jgi:hypothetical protein
MTVKTQGCADCGEKLSEIRISFDLIHCSACAENYKRCSRCGESHHLRDLRGAYCRSCRADYDRARFARQRAAREQAAASEPVRFVSEADP